MHRWLLFPAGPLLLAAAAFGQTATPEAQVLQALLTEIRQLRQDLQTNALTTQRVQIVLYRLQAQESSVTRATQRLDSARAKVADAQSIRRETAASIQQLEDRLNRAQDPAERKNLENALPRLKAQLEVFGTEEPQWQEKASEADRQLRLEQAKLSGLQDLLDRLDKALEDFSKQAGGGAR